MTEPSMSERRQSADSSTSSSHENKRSSSIDEPSNRPHRPNDAAPSTQVQPLHSDDEFHSCRDESNQSFSVTELSNLSGLSATYPETYSRGAELQRPERELTSSRALVDEPMNAHAVRSNRSAAAPATPPPASLHPRGRQLEASPHDTEGVTKRSVRRGPTRVGVEEDPYERTYAYGSNLPGVFPTSSPNASLTAPVAFGLSFDDILQQMQYALEDSQFEVDSLRLELNHQRKLNERNLGIIAMLRAGSPSTRHSGGLHAHSGHHHEQREARVLALKEPDLVKSSRPEAIAVAQTSNPSVVPVMDEHRSTERSTLAERDETSSHRSEPVVSSSKPELTAREEHGRLQRADAELNALKERCAQLEQQLVLAQQGPSSVESRTVETNTDTVAESCECVEVGLQTSTEVEAETETALMENTDPESPSLTAELVDQSSQTEQPPAAVVVGQRFFESIGTETDPLPPPPQKPAVRSIGLQPTLPLATGSAAQTDPIPVTIVSDLETATDMIGQLDGETQTEDPRPASGLAGRTAEGEYRLGSATSPWGELWTRVVENLRTGDATGVLGPNGEPLDGTTSIASVQLTAAAEPPPFRMITMSNLHPLPLEDHATAVREGLRLLRLSATQMRNELTNREESPTTSGVDESDLKECSELLEGATELLEASRSVIKHLQRELRCTRTVLHECAQERAGFEALASSLEKERRRLTEEVQSGASRSLQMRREARSLSPMERSSGYRAPPATAGAQLAVSPSSRSPSTQSQRSTSSSTLYRPTSGRTAPAPAAKVSPLKRIPRAGNASTPQPVRDQTATSVLPAQQEKSAGGEELQSVSSATYTNEDASTAPAQRRAAQRGGNTSVTPSRNSSPSLRPAIPRLTLDRVHFKSPSGQRLQGASSKPGSTRSPQPKDNRVVSPKAVRTGALGSGRAEPPPEMPRGATAAPAPSLLGPALTGPKERTTAVGRNGQVGFRAAPH